MNGLGTRAPTSQQRARPWPDSCGISGELLSSACHDVPSTLTRSTPTRLLIIILIAILGACSHATLHQPVLAAPRKIAASPLQILRSGDYPELAVFWSRETAAIPITAFGGDSSAPWATGPKHIFITLRNRSDLHRFQRLIARHVPLSICSIYDPNNNNRYALKHAVVTGYSTSRYGHGHPTIRLTIGSFSTTMRGHY